MPSQSSATNKLFGKIRSGFMAEKKFLKAYHEEATQTAMNEYQIPENQVTRLAKRALHAAIRTVRLHQWQPNLIRRTVQSQVAVLRWQQNRITETDYQEVHSILERYIRNHLGKCIGGELNPSQEIVYGETLITFLRRIKDPKFILTSTLDTYLIGIAGNLIKSFLRRRHRVPTNTFVAVVNHDTKLDEQEAVIMLEKINFYHASHQLVAHHLSQLDDKCLHIILQHYGIDEERIDAVGETPKPDEPMTEVEFDALFDVALGPMGKSRKLKEIALDLNMNPKKISEKHLECLDKLVQQVIPTLLDGPANAFTKTVREEMNVRLAEARTRKEKKKLEKQRYANSRRS